MKEIMKREKKIFKIPVQWIMVSEISIEAESEEEALKIANEKIDEIPVPQNGNFLDDSLEVNNDIELVKVINSKF